jgi:hypothetical protein
MALTSSVLSTSKNAVNIHEHHHKSMHHEDGEQSRMTHEISESKTMNNCQCIDCYCVQNIAAQANYSLVQNSVLTGYLPVVTTLLIMPEQNFISQLTLSQTLMAALAIILKSVQAKWVAVYITASITG